MSKQIGATDLLNPQQLSKPAETKEYLTLQLQARVIVFENLQKQYEADGLLPTRTAVEEQADKIANTQLKLSWYVDNEGVE